MANYADSAFFPLGDDKRYHIDIKVLRADNTCMQPVQCMAQIKILADVGADVTLLTNTEAKKLGYNLDMIYDQFPVAGINGKPNEFKQIDTWVQIGEMEPIFCPVGLAAQADGLYENLLGNKGLVGSGKITAHYDAKGVAYTSGMKAQFAGLT